MSSKLFLLIINPAAGKQQHLHKSESIISSLKERGYDYFVFETSIDPTENSLKGFLIQHPEISDLIILGGDGTINLVINSLPHFEYKIAVISNGTGNDSLKSIHGQRDFSKQLEIAVSENYRLIDLGLCNDRYFINGVGIGFDGLVVDHLLKEKKKRGGLWAYMFVVLKLLPFPKWWNMNISFDDRKVNSKIFSLTSANGTTFGGGFLMNPHASVDDGNLDICLFKRPTFIEKCLVLPFVVFGKHGFSRCVQFYKSKTLVVQTDDLVKAHIDGELMEAKHFTIQINKSFLKMKH